MAPDDLPDRAELVEVVARVDLHARPDLPDRAVLVEVVARVDPVELLSNLFETI